MVERKSFKDLLKLLNPNVGPMLVQRHAIAQHTRRVFDQYQQHISDNYLSKAQYVAFTIDGWTSPNNLPYLSVTAHFIDKDWDLMDLVLGIPLITGASQFFFFTF